VLDFDRLGLPSLAWQASSGEGVIQTCPDCMDASMSPGSASSVDNFVLQPIFSLLILEINFVILAIN
jgi:hypothetical protein